MKALWYIALAAIMKVLLGLGQASFAQAQCDSSYPDICIAPAPPDLDCKNITHRNFRVQPPDSHYFDGDEDGIGCEVPSPKTV